MKESTDRKLTKLTKHLWIILGAVLIILGFFTYFPMLFKTAYNNNLYDVSEVERITGLQFEEKAEKIVGVSCKRLNCKSKSKSESEFADLTFFLFPNVKSAEKALKKLADSGYFYGHTVICTDNSVEGYLQGVCDAEVYEYYYRSGNLVVKTEASYGCFGTREEIDQMAEAAKKQNERIANLKEWLPTVFKTEK